MQRMEGNRGASSTIACANRRSGKWVSSVVYADDVVLLSWSASGLQLLLDSMNRFCLGMGLIISPTKTEVDVFNGPGTASTWRVGAQVLPQSASFKYLGLIFHESGTMSYALQRLAHNAVGASAQLRAKFRGLLCQQSFPMMRRLFDALVLSTVSYGSEVWVPSCSPSLPRDIKKMCEVHLAFFRQLCRLKKSVTPAVIFRELSERPWVHRWWNQVIGFMHRLSNMPDDSIHAETLRDNVADAQQHPSCDNWADGVVKQYSRLGMEGQHAWGLMLCQSNRVGLQDQPSPGISAAALCVRPGRWGMRGTLFLTALILPTFAASFVRCIKNLMVPCSVLCGTRTRRLFATAWQPFSTWLMTPTKTRPHQPMLAEWTSEILSLSLFREFSERPWHGVPSCWASCAACRCCLMTASILTFSGIMPLMQGAL